MSTSEPVAGAAAAPAARAPRSEHFLVSGEGIEPVAEGVWILKGQGNSLVVDTDAGLVVVDAGPGGRVTAGMIVALRTATDAPVHAICHSHGHLGYNGGVPLWLEHARSRGEPAPRLVAHANLPKRQARYRETMPLQERMAELQFRREPLAMSGKLAVHPPTETFDDRLVMGDPRGRHAVLLAAPSETDDAIAVWHPATRILYGGPAVIDSIPNVGTPFRTMRDPVRWADTLERLAALHPRAVIREFGPRIEGEDDVQRVLTQTARALRWVRAEVVRMMNEGMAEAAILAGLRFPPELFDTPWMQPTYGDPHWIARDVWRSENGWWDRNPTTLHPSAPVDVGRAIAEAITDKPAVLANARRLAESGDTQLALHVLDLLATLESDDPSIGEARRIKAELMRRRAGEVRSYISKSLYRAAADAIDAGTAGRFGIR